MNQLSKTKSILYHLYPGVFITAAFILITPYVINCGYPPQLAMLLLIILVAVPVMLIHLLRVKRTEQLKRVWLVNGLTCRINSGRLTIYVVLLVAAAFVIWGITQPLDKWIAGHFFKWLPKWYTVQDFGGYPHSKVKLTLILNLLLNGLVAPLVEEFYFRGYLLPRMKAWGKHAFLVNAVLFSLYHFWQPYVYLTLIMALLPMTWLASRTRDLRLSVLTHALMNLLGALLSFGLLAK